MVTMAIDPETLAGVISKLSGIVAQLTVDKALAETQRDQLQAKLDVRPAPTPEVIHDITNVTE